MHTVCELKSFERAAKEAGLSDEEVSDLVIFIAKNPTSGDVMEGTGGCRKVRVRGRNTGKSGGYRTITFFTGNELPVFLITMFEKGEKVTLTKAQRNALAALTKELVAEYRNRVVSVGRTA